HVDWASLNHRIRENASSRQLGRWCELRWLRLDVEASAKRDAPASLARRAVRSRFGADVFGSEVTDKLVDAGYLEISAKDHPDAFGFLLDDEQLAVLQLIAEGGGGHPPKAPALGGGDLLATRSWRLALALGCGKPGSPCARNVAYLGPRRTG